MRRRNCRVRMHFNSRPHKEVDGFFSVALIVFTNISTHDLTRRSTGTMRLSSKELAFQLTTSQGGRLQPIQRTLQA